MLTSNHLSHADAPVLSSTLRRNGYQDIAGRVINILGIRIMKHPIAGFLAASYPHIVVWPRAEETKNDIEEMARKRYNNTALKAAKTALELGQIISLFPQGGRAYSTVIEKPINPRDLVYTTLVKGTNIVPIGQWGLEKILPRKKWIPRPNTTFTIVGKPYPVSEIVQSGHIIPTQKEADEIMLRVARLLPDRYRGYYSEPQNQQ